MAGNLLPILLLGGGALLVMGKKKKKKKAPSCPAEVTIRELTDAQAQEMGNQAWADAGGDPILAADIIFEQLVPPGCTKKDYKTRAISKRLTESKPLDWNLSMLYAAIVSEILDAYIDMDDERQVAQAKGVMQRVANWYTQTTGEPMPDID